MKRRTFFSMFVCMACAALPLPAQAQNARPLRPPSIPSAQLVVANAEKPIELSTLDIHTEIAGRQAWTTVEMAFHNPNARVLEGELQFPLRDGQTITAFALSMPGANGQETMRDAVPVDKNKGRQVFENVIRQRIDPALLEKAQGNNFKLRVYPLNPGQTRRVRLTYSERLAQTPNGTALYRLPLSYGQAGQFRLAIEAEGMRKPPVITRQNAPAGVKLAFRKSSGTYSARTEAQNVRLLGNELTLTVPSAEEGITVGARDGTQYFHTEIPAPATDALPAPQTLAILWDASLSGRTRNHAQEFAFLDAYFAKVRNIKVRLQQARNVADAPRNFTVEDGNWSDLRKALESTVYDGATNLGAFDVKTPANLFFLFSDGLDNYSNSAKPLAAPDAPLFALLSTTGADVARLRGLSAHGGVIDLGASSASAAAARAMRRNPSIVAVEGGVADTVWEMSPEGGVFIVAGIVHDSSRPLRVIFEGGKTVERTFSAKKAKFDGVPHLWAALKIARMEGEYELHRGEIRRLGRAFSIATRETSLIVLDRVEDYALHDIEPPPELKAAYEQWRARMPQQHVRTDKLAWVLREWEARDAWWKTDFPKVVPVEKPRPIPQPSLSEDSRMTGCINCFIAQPSVAPSSVAASPVEPVVRSAPSVGEKSASASIALRAWSPDDAWFRRMKEARAEDLYRIYLDERPDYENSVAFYLDMAHELAQRGQKALSLRVLSNLAEMDLENRQILRVLGYRLLEAGMPQQAIFVFKRVLALADDEPQSYRDLGLAHAAAGEYQLAVDRLYDVVEKQFARNFPGIEVIALTELNAIVAAAPAPLNTQRIDSRFLVNRPLDLRVVLTWNSDETDINLHVTDPDGEEAVYYQPTRQGGRMSLNNATGYGPEEFTLKKAKPGKYRVEASFYSHRQQVLLNATVIQLDFFARYGSRDVRKQSVTMRLKSPGEKVLVGEFEVQK